MSISGLVASFAALLYLSTANLGIVAGIALGFVAALVGIHIAMQRHLKE